MQFVEAVVSLALEAEALVLGVWSYGLAGHTGIDRIRRNLIAERINRALGIAQIVIPMHFLVEILQTSK